MGSAIGAGRASIQNSATRRRGSRSWLVRASDSARAFRIRGIGTVWSRWLNAHSAESLDRRATGYCPDLGLIVGMLASMSEMRAGHVAGDEM